MSKLVVIAETDGSKILPATFPVVAFAQEWSKLTNGTFDIVVVGGISIESTGEQVSQFGAAKIVVISGDSLEHPIAEIVADAVIAAFKQMAATSIAGASTQFGRDVLPHIAALLDLPMVTDVLEIHAGADGLEFKRPMYAGNVIAIVRVDGNEGVFSIRTTAFDKPIESQSQSELVTIPAPPPSQITRWISLDAPKQSRPDLTAARVVVSGGRPLRDGATFERLLGGLADKIGGAVGATRAAVDSGIAPNELQVGQTGKIVAPDLYIAAGVSGSVQHLAGMKESKVIVAINNDPEAPIFDVADYGLVADLHQAIPELTSKL